MYTLSISNWLYSCISIWSPMLFVIDDTGCNLYIIMVSNQACYLYQTGCTIVYHCSLQSCMLLISDWCYSCISIRSPMFFVVDIRLTLLLYITLVSCAVWYRYQTDSTLVYHFSLQCCMLSLSDWLYSCISL